MAAGVKLGRKPKLSPYQRAEAINRRAAGETLASIARSYGVAISWGPNPTSSCIAFWGRLGASNVPC